MNLCSWCVVPKAPRDAFVRAIVAGQNSVQVACPIICGATCTHLCMYISLQRHPASCSCITISAYSGRNSGWAWLHTGVLILSTCASTCARWSMSYAVSRPTLGFFSMTQKKVVVQQCNPGRGGKLIPKKCLSGGGGNLNTRS